MQIKGNRFLVVGGAGFIGSHIVDQLLAEGASCVRVYDNFSRGSRSNLDQALNDERFEIYPHGGDIMHRDTLEDAMTGMDGVFHLAALWLLQCHEYPRSAFDVNVAGVMNVVEAVIRSGVKRLVFSSSASVYGDAITEPMAEDHPFLCNEFYGASKVCGEMLLRALYNKERHKPGGFSYVGLRYMNVYGPRQHVDGPYIGVVANMLKALDAGEVPVVYGDGRQSYDFVHVQDCARANILAMLSESTDRCYNVGTGKKTSVADLASLLLSMYGNTASPRFQPVSRPYVMNRIGAVDLAGKELGFSSEISLERGLGELVGSPGGVNVDNGR